jgi:hypothetical protein
MRKQARLPLEGCMEFQDEGLLHSGLTRAYEQMVQE